MKKPTYEELLKKVEKLEKATEIQFKIGAKGGVSAYGLGRFPVTLYFEQWMRLLDAHEELRKFLKENEGKLKKK